VLGQVPSIAVSVGDEKDNDGKTAVTALQSDPPIERLQVEQPHLGFNRDRGPVKNTLRVPRALVARDWKRNLQPPWSSGRQLVPEALEQAGVRLVAHRVTVRVGATVEPKPNRSRRDCQLSDRDAR